MWWKLEEDLYVESRRQIREFERYAKKTYDENERRKRRSVGSPQLEVVRHPDTWSLSPGFDPYRVRRRRAAIAHSVANSLRAGTYQPARPAGFLVPKVGGGKRLVSTFEIVDAVISSRLYRSLLRKNLPLLSARSYAYRPDLSPHDALLHLRSELRTEQRIFVAEYDFSKFFDRISHEHLDRCFSDLAVVATPLERRLVNKFITSPKPYLDVAEKQLAQPRATEGVPQGTSISLFLANLAATPLDRELERLGVSFVRYADDTLIWSRDYGSLCEAVEALHRFSELSQVPINAEKSAGIRLLVPAETRNVEFAFTRSVDYLGHAAALRSLGMKDSAEARVRSRIQRLIYDNLLREPIAGTQDLSRLTGVDRDYVTFIWQLRRYLYGPLNEQQVRRFQSGSIPPMSFQGLMSFFPLVDDQALLLRLDAWIASQVWLAMRKRQRLLAGSRSNPVPWGIDQRALIGLRARSTRTGAPIDLRLPSVRRIAAVVGRAVQTYGTSSVGRGGALYLY